MKNEFLVIYTTFPTMRIAKEIVDGLVRTKRAACGNIFKLSSIYRWKGKIEKCTEYGAFIKTRKSKYRSVQRYIEENHPYDVPEIIALNIDRGQRDYLNWLKRATE
ncbi:MAG: divalent-cation tolerance protein CutA [candidate division WOR-3 bacterium]|nr:MAG: divalent-cation tolerance protein CutA [candidate division WOR-3 bacterium]